MKRKYFYRTAVLSLAVLVSAIFGTSSYNANAAPINHSIHVKGTSLLKVNDYDVLYCAPIGPYVNEEKRLMVPLRSVAELLGAKVDYNGKLQEAKIRWSSNEIVFQKGAKTYKLNNTPAQMDTQPEVIQDAFVIPLGVLLRSMNIPFEYRNNKVILKNPAFDQSKTFQRVIELDQGRFILDNPSALDIQNFKLVEEKNSAGETRGSITVSGLNRTGSTIREGKEDLHIIGYFNQTVDMDADFASIDLPDRKRPKVNPEGSVSQSLSYLKINDPLQYILAAGRTIQTKNERK
ncbi:copper amine oxidase N-terminal domain-containing protein [Paenibacillus polymyxa]|uniref:copper amine oxidase N-terminal domain-containing protein n=1 Tax=Paenibacillus TaxID=44249 RepID=UPI0004D63789|nr:copper amine oxidase N-terminal domain-containing protein [Paenibacillus polymyxa]KEO75977.1 peptidase M23 [Paenibacillus polymyxa]MCH6190958.1 copper amine oxidase N-terminal domain-containing protein [Paenibacillus polymyxa]MDY8096342.1 copper amine oxidase N-terminal domain-containing protein [Paenibacillus polymyxa]WRL57768.1 copper amine oxidase N-terminal domain-containing protein [Paenibacillus polymyxa]